MYFVFYRLMLKGNYLEAFQANVPSILLFCVFIINLEQNFKVPSEKDAFFMAMVLLSFPFIVSEPYSNIQSKNI